VEIQPLEGSAYQIRFSSGEAELELRVYPVLFGELLEKARSEHQASLHSYEREQAAWNKRLNEYRQSLEDGLSEHLSNTQPPSEPQSERNRIRSRFSLDQLGIWNCNRLLPIDTYVLANPLRGEEGASYQNHLGYMIVEGQNTVYRFYAGEKARIPLSESQPSKIWVLDEQKRVALQNGFTQAWREQLDEIILSLPARQPTEPAQFKEWLLE
jgi:hypothetical protein